MSEVPEHTLHCACVPPSDVHTEAQAEADAVAEVAVAEIEIAKIESDTAIKLAQIAAKTVEPDLEAQLAAALAEVDALKSVLTPPAPEVVEQPPAEPEPVVVVNDIESDSNNDVEVPPDVERKPESAPKRRGMGLW